MIKPIMTYKQVLVKNIIISTYSKTIDLKRKTSKNLFLAIVESIINKFSWNNRNTINCTIIAPKNKKALGFLREPIAIVGGVGGIRTHARGKPSNDLANRPLQPLEYHSV